MGTRTWWGLSRVLMIILGLWLIAGHYILEFGTIEAKANDAIVGFFLVLLALSRLIPFEDNAWVSWLSALLGIWVIASPFLFGYSDSSSSLTNAIVAGVLITALGIFNGLAGPQRLNAHH